MRSHVTVYYWGRTQHLVLSGRSRESRFPGRRLRIAGAGRPGRVKDRAATAPAAARLRAVLEAGGLAGASWERGRAVRPVRAASGV